jgi:hypothetical protein
MSEMLGWLGKVCYTIFICAKFQGQAREIELLKNQKRVVTAWWAFGISGLLLAISEIILLGMIGLNTFAPYESAGQKSGVVSRLVSDALDTTRSNVLADATTWILTLGCFLVLSAILIGVHWLLVRMKKSATRHFEMNHIFYQASMNATWTVLFVLGVSVFVWLFSVFFQGVLLYRFSEIIAPIILLGETLNK